MVFTDNSDIYVAIHDEGINRIARHVFLQRPSLFNYATRFLSQHPELVCKQIESAHEVTAKNNPLMGVVPPLPILGTTYGLNYSAQVTNLEIDFHPRDVFELPESMGTLANQQLAIHLKLCTGIGCPGDDLPNPSVSINRFDNFDITNFEELIPELPEAGEINRILPTSKLECFCLDLFATSSVKITGPKGNQLIRSKVEDIEIVDLKPSGLENGIECYAKTTLNLGILPTISTAISNIAFGIIDLPDGLGTLQVAGSSVPNNPAIEEDQLKAFVDIENIVLNISSSGDLPSSGGEGDYVRTTRPRTRSGTYDFTAALSEEFFVKIFDAVLKGFIFKRKDTVTLGPFTFTYDVKAHLEGGSIELDENGSIKVNELDIKWDNLSLDICVDVPKICTPEVCTPTPLGDVCLPQVCIFEEEPDFCIPFNLGGLITSEITMSVIPKVYYGIGSGVPNQWQIAMTPTLPIDVDIIDIADTAGDLFDRFANELEDIGIPSWLTGGASWIIRTVLDIGDDIGEWILDQISDMGIYQYLIDELAEYISITIFSVNDPQEIIPADGPLIPVKLPIEYLGIEVNDKEMVMVGDVGN